MLKLIDAHSVKVGTTINVDGQPCVVRTIDISKTGKHGASKCRIEAVGIIDDKKRVVAVPGHERFEVPMIDKRKGQILSVAGNKASLMDLETFETIEIEIDEEMQKALKDNDNVEYWEIEGRKLIKRVNQNG
jgi:translation initiation factor 5A